LSKPARTRTDKQKNEEAEKVRNSEDPTPVNDIMVLSRAVYSKMGHSRYSGCPGPVCILPLASEIT
jgi:hypothetical protein